MYTVPPPNIYDIATCLQLICNCISTQNLKFKDLKFGQETFKQLTHGSISTNLPQYINDLHAFMLMGFCFCIWRLKVLILTFKEVESFFFAFGCLEFLSLLLKRLKVFAFGCLEFLSLLLKTLKVFAFAF
jgi:hypothetical protein